MDGEASRDHNERENAERVRNLAERAGIPSGLALALILKYGNDPDVLDREAAKLKRDAG
ncbi:iron-containing alcohol dehydrogenase [Mesorhizobium sp. B2-7-1]|uniref:iron-containing alcohol dehydrogenase n=1 Tax=Mesorhizobium sp. B2-7-1 TaxID=2589909 RepID=UPI00112BE492|nr:iron-containing alcohol dehydrogenase [Mesorhizobium sp. B2-7-1]TPJ74677.1 iron-containing alcohol dehydrogenase [Mesorhizobium sp. B2-7-1]